VEAAGYWTAQRDTWATVTKTGNGSPNRDGNRKRFSLPSPWTKPPPGFKRQAGA
jgi:hypothetical protein